MRVINLVSWAGQDFDYKVGEAIELPKDVAEARIEAELCRLPDPKKKE